MRHSGWLERSLSTAPAPRARTSSVSPTASLKKSDASGAVACGTPVWLQRSTAHSPWRSNTSASPGCQVATLLYERVTVTVCCARSDTGSRADSPLLQAVAMNSMGRTDRLAAGGAGICSALGTAQHPDQ